jgi:hypothetical protein
VVLICLSVVHEVVTLKYLWTAWIPGKTIPVHLAGFLFSAALIYFISRGRNWARVIYAAQLVLRAANVVWYLPQDLATSRPMVLITGVSFACQFFAMYVLFTNPGRLWFKPLRTKSTDPSVSTEAQ